MAAAVATIVTFSGTVCVSAPERPVELPFSVSVNVCGRADAPTVNLKIDDAGVPVTGAIGLMLNNVLTPVGVPVADSVTLSLKLPSAVAWTAVEPTPPRGIGSVAGLTDSAKS